MELKELVVRVAQDDSLYLQVIDATQYSDPDYTYEEEEMYRLWDVLEEELSEKYTGFCLQW